MAQIIEFVGNHPLLFVALAFTLGMLGFTEYQRFFNSVKSLSPYEATKLMNSGDAVFIDVRDDSEYKRGHVIDATNIPVSAVDNRIHELEKFKEKNLVVYCDSGMRSQKVSAKLKKNGFSNLHNLAGGIIAWEKASLPVVTR